MRRKHVPQKKTKRNKSGRTQRSTPSASRRQSHHIAVDDWIGAGGNFFRSLSRYLAESLKLDFVFIGELTGENKHRVKTIGLYAAGQHGDDFSYALSGTPCENVVAKGFCVYPKDVQRRFPKDPLLSDKGIESFLATPLRSRTHDVLGVLVAMDRKPLKQPKQAERMLRSFAAHAAAELERMRAEEVLREHEAFLQLSQKVGHVGSWDWDLATDKVRWSDQMYWIYGLGREEFDGTFAAAMARIHPEDRPRIEREAKAMLERKASLSTEFRIVWPDGTVRDAWGLAELICDDAGRPTRAVGTVQDISDRKRAERELASSRELLDVALRASNVGLWSWNIHTGEVYLSSRWKAQLGYQDHEVANSFGAWETRLHPDDRDRVLRTVESYVAQPWPDYEVEFRMRHKDGSYRWMLVRADIYPGADGKPERMMGCHIDITERVHADEEKQKLISLIGHSRSFVGMATMEGRMLFVNRGGQTLVGLPDTAAVDATELVDYVLPQDAAELRDRVLPGLLESGYWESEFRLRHFPSGTPIDMLMNAFVINDANTGDPTAIAVIGRDIREQKRSQRALVEAHEALEAAHSQLAAIIERAPSVAMQGYDADGRVLFWNRASEVLYGFAAEETVGKRLGGRMLSDQDVSEFEGLIKEVLSRNKPAPQREWVTRTRSGEIRWVVSSIFPIRFGENQTQVIRMDIDVTAKKAADEEMRKLSSAIRQTADSVIITDHDGVIEYVNHAFEETTGFRLHEALGKKPNLVKSGVHDPEIYERLWETILRGETFRDVFINRKKNGDLYYEEKTITPLKNDAGAITHFISTGKDIAERMQAQERLQFLAHHDALTGLPNRTLLVDRLGQALIRAHWHERVVAVMFLDLDRFKTINDTLGHNVGDHFLQGIASRLAAVVRDGDTLARLGGDEFAIVLEDIAQPEDVSMVATKILNAFAKPYMLSDRELFITCSIGISLYPSDGTDALTLLRNADAAMYRAKELGKNTYQFYSADMSAMDFGRLSMESNLRHALEREEFLLYYQPQVDLHTGRILGVEALLRWRHPEFGLITPVQFVALAEETGMIGPIGEWVARTALAQARAWEDEGYGPLRMAINVSGRQFNEVVFIDMINRLLEEFGVSPARSEFEITESVIMRNAKITNEKLRALRALGVRFAIDDFGTGYSSLSYLRRFPISTLKIDRSFVNGVTSSQEDAEIVRTVVTMAHSLKLQVVAEGVETREALRFLREIDCDVIQGNYFSRPLPPEEITKLLRDGKCLEAEECGLKRVSGAGGGLRIPRQ